MLELKDTTEASTAYVTDSATPELVEVTAPKGATVGSGTAKAAIDAPVTVTAPAASDVIAGSQLGL